MLEKIAEISILVIFAISAPALIIILCRALSGKCMFLPEESDNEERVTTRPSRTASPPVASSL